MRKRRFESGLALGLDTPLTRRIPLMGTATRHTGIPIRTPMGTAIRTSTAATMAACTDGVDTAAAMAATDIAAATMAAPGALMADTAAAVGTVVAVAQLLVVVVVVAPEAAGKQLIGEH